MADGVSPGAATCCGAACGAARGTACGKYAAESPEAGATGTVAPVGAAGAPKAAAADSAGGGSHDGSHETPLSPAICFMYVWQSPRFGGCSESLIMILSFTR